MADGDLISRASLLAGIEELKESPWYNYGNYEGDFYDMTAATTFELSRYSARKEAVEIIVDVCIKKEPAVLADSCWVSVEDRLPENETEVLIYSPELVDTIKLAMWIEDGFYVDKEDLIVKAEPNGYCTHWMPLPKPPKGE